MNASDEWVVELSKKKIILLVVGACAFVALGIWMLSLDGTFIQAQHRYNNPAFVHGIGLIAALFFGVCGLLGFKKLFDAKPGLIINASGFVDNASSVSAGFVPWSEVIGLEVRENQKQKMLVVKVKNPQQDVERGSSFRRVLNRANHKMCGQQESAH